jgi:hypothetical protein
MRPSKGVSYQLTDKGGQGKGRIQVCPNWRFLRGWRQAN